MTEKHYHHQEYPKTLFSLSPDSTQLLTMVVRSQEEMKTQLKARWQEAPPEPVVRSLTDSAEEMQKLWERITELEQENADLKVKAKAQAHKPKHE